MSARASALHPLIDAIDDPLLVQDASSGRLVEANSAACSFFGLTRERLLEGSLEALVAAGGDAARLRECISSALASGAARGEFRARCKQGEIAADVRLRSAELNAERWLVAVVRDISAEKRAAEAQRLVEERYRVLVGNLPNSAIIVCDHDLRIVLVDGPEVAATGFSKAAMEGRGLYEALPLEFAKLVEGNIRRVLTGETFSAELPFEDRWYVYNYVPLRDSSARVVYGMILALNVTERHRAEQARRASEERFRRLFQLSPDSMAVTRLSDGMVLEINHGFERHFGWTREEALGKTTLELGIWPEAPQRDEFVTQLNPDGSPQEFVRTFRRRDGTHVTGQLALRSIEFDGHACVLSTFRDIAEQLRARQELEASEQRLRGLAEATFEGIGIAERGTIIDANDQFAAMYGRTRAEIIGMPLMDLIAPESRPLVRERAATASSEPYEHLALRADGSVFPVEVRPRSVEIGGRQLRVAAVRDVTLRKRADAERERMIAELQASNAEMEQFIYTVSHDLKSPLVTINGFVGLLERDLESGDAARTRGDLQRITSATHKMMKLLGDLLTLSRVGRVGNPPARVPLSEIVAEALELCSGPIAARGVEVHVQRDLPEVFGDRGRLVQVFQNLLENAAKYMGTEPHPEIEIGTRPDPERLVCFVRDNGIGVDPRYKERIFGLFEKLDPRSEGTGVGLALVRRIVEFHGGRVWVESDGVRGSRFVLELPREPSSRAASSGQVGRTGP